VLVSHSQAKDQILKVAIKQMKGAQIFEDELKEVSELNSVLFTQNQELEAKLAKNARQKRVSLH
jgi:predicted  nucleic acid-binding Zn ribbon protein